MAKFVTDASGATWWPNLEPMQVAFFLLAEEITQVKEAIPWVRCASGNVWSCQCGHSIVEQYLGCQLGEKLKQFYLLFEKKVFWGQSNVGMGSPPFSLAPFL